MLAAHCESGPERSTRGGGGNLWLGFGELERIGVMVEGDGGLHVVLHVTTSVDARTQLVDALHVRVVDVPAHHFAPLQMSRHVERLALGEVDLLEPHNGGHRAPVLVAVNSSSKNTIYRCEAMPFVVVNHAYITSTHPPMRPIHPSTHSSDHTCIIPRPKHLLAFNYRSLETLLGFLDAAPTQILEPIQPLSTQICKHLN